MEEKKSYGHGGARAGAGRPKSDNDSKLYAFRASKDIAEIIEAHENKSKFIQECIANAEERSIASAKEHFASITPAEKVEPLTLPFFDIKVVAGFPIPLNNDEISQDIEILKLLCPHPESSYLIRVQGESMRDADIHSGDILIVDKSNSNPSKSEVAICELNGEYTVKRVERRGDTAYLIPANPEFPEIEITPNDDFSVWGTVTYVIHKPRT